MSALRSGPKVNAPRGTATVESFNAEIADESGALGADGSCGNFVKDHPTAIGGCPTKDGRRRKDN